MNDRSKRFYEDDDRAFAFEEPKPKLLPKLRGKTIIVKEGDPKLSMSQEDLKFLKECYDGKCKVFQEEKEES